MNNCHSNAIEADSKGDCVFIGYGSLWQNPFSFNNDPAAELESFRRWFFSKASAAELMRKQVDEKLFNQSLLCDCCNDDFCHRKVYEEHLNRERPTKFGFWRHRESSRRFLYYKPHK